MFRGKREVIGFGWRYDYSARRLHQASPDFLLPLRRAVAVLAGEDDTVFVQALVTRYAEGAGIGWHRDRPDFDTVIGVSLQSPRTLRFRRRDGEGWARRSLLIEPRSAYVMKGPSRYQWEHGIAAGGPLRYSVTFAACGISHPDPVMGRTSAVARRSRTIGRRGEGQCVN